MATTHCLSRRTFLHVGLATAGLSLLGACAPAAPATKPVESKPAAPTSAAAQPVAESKPTAPAAQPAAPAAQPTTPAKPAATAAPAEPKMGSNLVGKLEGPEVLPDAKRPPKLGESPVWAEMVKAGTLPPVEQRIPEEPLVIKPLHEVGKYGGIWRRGFTGPGDGEQGNRIISSDKLVFWDYRGATQKPSVAKGWEITDGGRTITFFLRKGHKWSDGTPFTADDVMFWYEDLYQNKELTPTPTAELSINGKPGTIEKVDDLTFRFTFPDPYPGFMDVIGGSTYLGSSQNQGGGESGLRGVIAPKHYLSKFLPKYVGQETVDKQAKDAGFDNWRTYFIQFAANWRINTNLPMLAAWKTAQPINTPAWVLERNPYYYAVDTEGNQLPYFDKVQMTLAENLEVLNLRAIAGEYDSQERHTALNKIPVFLENQQKGNYTVHLDPAANGADAGIHFNQSYNADPEVAKWLRNRDFRHAIALGIDRDQLNEVFWVGVGTPGSVVPSEDTVYNPGPEWRKKWATLDVAQANQLLDKIGLDKKDSEGYRLRTDGKGRLRLELIGVAGAFVPFPQVCEMVAQQVKKIGIQLDAVEQERSLYQKRRDGNELQLNMWANDGTELLYAFPSQALPINPTVWLGPEIGRWYASGGSQGMKPEDPELLRALELFRAGAGQPDAERIKTAQEVWKILAEEAFSVGTVGLSPAIMGLRIVKNNVGNVPSRQMNAQHARTPCSSHPTTMYFKS
jgi:peptide/nickel transport system substrate-binding protein